MNKLGNFQVAGTLSNGDAFKVIVTAMYGYDAMRKATAKVGKIATASATGGNPDGTFVRSVSSSTTISGMQAVVKTRKAQVNSTTASNTFTFNSYTFALTSAQVLATGTLNWIAIGE